jgi:hypothetical protein
MLKNNLFSFYFARKLIYIAFYDVLINKFKKKETNTIYVQEHDVFLTLDNLFIIFVDVRLR